MKSIKQKSMLFLSTLSIMVMLIVLGGSYFLVEGYFEKSLNKQIKDSDQALSVVLKEPIFSYDSSVINNIITSFVDFPYIHDIQAFDQRGKLIGGTQALSEQQELMELSTNRVDVVWEDNNQIGYLEVAYRLDANDQLLMSTKMMFALIAVVLLIALQATNWIVLTKYVVKPIDLVANAMSELAQGEGDLTRRLNISSRDEVGVLSKGFDSFISNLQKLVQRIVYSADELSGCSGEIKVKGDNNAASAKQQLDNIVQVTTAVQQMSSVTEEVAQHATHTAAKTQTCNELALKGSTIVKKTIDDIHNLGSEIADTSEKVLDLRDKSDRINTVLEVIKEIAEQTNLLALNAAIEAARAGDQGRGFSVVADEVRALAKRTHHSTSEIENIIKDLQSSSEDVDKSMSGAKNTLSQTISESHQAIGALDDIIEGMRVINDMNTQIAAATEEQNIVAANVSEKFVSMNSIIDTINVSAERVVELGVKLDGLRENIKGDLSKFKL